TDTWNTPRFLGLDGPNGVWAKYGGPAKAGDGVVVGDIDSGIWPESASFAGAPVTSTEAGPWGLKRKLDGGITMRKADGTTFSGACQTGQDWTVENCNS